LGQSSKNIGRLVIVGGGTAGWMAAAACAYKLSGLVSSITLIESQEIGTVGVGEATLPHIRFFNKTLGIDEAQMMAETRATFKLGIEFCNWGKLGDRYIHPFGDYGHSMNGLPFHHHWVRARQAGANDPIDHYSYPVMAAQADRFTLPSNDPKSLLSTFSYAFQFDASLYAAFLGRYAKGHGVKRVEGKITTVNQNPESGVIESVVLEDGTSVEGDLFIDCSGFSGLLIEQTLQTGYDDWSRYLPCNRALAVPCESAGVIGPYTRATARDAGWQWRIPLQHRTGNGHVYCSDYISDDEAANVLLSNLDGKVLGEPRQLYFKTGRRRKQWNKNVVAIGLAGGFLEPLESTSIHLIQAGITNLMDMFPNSDFRDADADEYNRVMDLEYDRIRDFLVLHYVANERDDAPMWRDLRNMMLPDTLAYKMKMFRERGLIPEYAHGLFLPASWLAVFIGQNIIPKHYDPRANQMPVEELQARLSRLRHGIDAAVAGTSDHMAFIRDNGAAMAKAA
jgi:tryptophan 7-halogenase